MPKYVAFLRAINVGGHIVKMDHLRTLFESMGFENVETFIASGNVIFESRIKSTGSLEKRIQDSLQQALGYPVATFIRTIDELCAIDLYQPFSDSELNGSGVLYIAFLSGPPGDDEAQKLLSLKSEIDEFHVSGREAYWLCRAKMSESKFSGALLERTLARAATIRNANTVKRLVAKCSK